VHFRELDDTPCVVHCSSRRHENWHLRVRAELGLIKVGKLKLMM
jgi:hypothetical protein